MVNGLIFLIFPPDHYFHTITTFSEDKSNFMMNPKHLRYLASRYLKERCYQHKLWAWKCSQIVYTLQKHKNLKGKNLFNIAHYWLKLKLYFLEPNILERSKWYKSMPVRRLWSEAPWSSGGENPWKFANFANLGWNLLMHEHLCLSVHVDNKLKCI